MQETRLILVAGEPASGKSTLGKSLAQRIRATYLDMDTISFPFLERFLEEDPGFKDSSRYRDRYREVEYRSLLEIAAENLTVGNDCIVVAPFSAERANPALQAHLYERFRITATTIGVDITIDRTQQLENIIARGEARDAAKVHALVEETPPPVPPPVWNVDRVLTVDYSELSSSFDEIVQGIASFILR